MKLLYISGPYRAPSIRGIVENILRAEAWALYFWQRGYAVICPHKNTALFDGAAPDGTWIAGDLEILKRCDILFAMPGWETSAGAKIEIEEAYRLHIPVLWHGEITDGPKG